MPKPTGSKTRGRPKFIQDKTDKPVEKPNNTKTNMTDNITVSFGFTAR